MAQTWEYRDYQIGQRDGSKKFRVYNGRKQIEVDTKEQAEAIIDERIQRLNHASDLSHVPSVRISDILVSYKQWASKQRDATTVRNVLLTWRRFEPLTWLHEVTKEEVIKWLESNSNWSNGTYRANLLNVRSVLSYATKLEGNNYLVDKRVYDISLPKHFPKEKTQATEAHVKALLDYFVNSDWRLQFVALAFVEWGMRPATIPQILKSDVKGDHIFLRKEDERTKTEADCTLLISDELKPFVEKALAENTNEFLFNDSDATPWSVQGIESIMKRLHAAKALPPEITWYSFRIKKDNQLIADGVDPITHAALMNHGMSMIRKVYARVNIAKEIQRLKSKNKPVQYKDEAGKTHYFDTKEQLMEFLAGKPPTASN
jgi:site-specific recombinase XerD